MKIIIKGDFTLEGDIELIAKVKGTLKYAVLETIEPPPIRLIEFSIEEKKA